MVLFIIFAVLRIEPKTSGMLNKHYTIELHRQYTYLIHFESYVANMFSL